MRRVTALGSVALLALFAHAGIATATVTTTETGRPVVNVLGDDSPDVIQVACEQDLLKINGTDPPQGPASCAALIELHVFGGGGDDLLDLSRLDLGILALHDENPPPQITMAGGEGDDHLLVGGGVGQSNGGPGADTMVGFGPSTFLAGGPGPDRLRGGNGADFLFGDEGRDVLVGGSDQDFIVGGNGADRLRGVEGSDLLAGIAGNDRLAGGPGGDSISGGGGRDLLRGGAGNDKLFGGPAVDRLIGGPGDDREVQEGSLLLALFGQLLQAFD